MLKYVDKIAPSLPLRDCEMERNDSTFDQILGSKALKLSFYGNHREIEREADAAERNC